jgi:transposase-like protein
MMGMDPHTVFCPNPACPARGRVGEGNIWIHSQKERRYRCQVCGKTFVERKGTPFYRLHQSVELFVQVITLLAYGCPPQAIVKAFGLDERTVTHWQQKAGAQCQAVHEHLVVTPQRALGEVQADEIRVKRQGGVVWMAMAIMVSARLWLGGVVSPHRDTALITSLMQRVYAGALCRPMLFVVDGLKTYVSAIRKVFRERIPTGRGGRPRLREWAGVCIAQVIKQYAQRRLVGVVRQVVQGTAAGVEAVRHKVGGGGVLNTSFIERLNGTFRERLAALARRTRALARDLATLAAGMYVVGTVYNFCAEQRSLRMAGVIGGHKWLGRTPAMAAGITNHCWSVEELLSYHVPPSRWTPPQQRGRPSRATKRLIERWCA